MSAADIAPTLGELRDEAIALAAAGYPVFPCDGKRPHTAHGLKDASTDEATIRRWWASNTWNIGLRTGADSGPDGLVALDVDGPTGEASLAALEGTRHKLPETAEQATPSGGRHLLFQHPGGDIRPSAGVLGDGLDVRADDAYVIVAPSGGYRWEYGRGLLDGVLTSLPDWWVEKLSAPAAPTSQASNGTGPAVRIPKGKRNSGLASIGGRYRDWGWQETRIEAELQMDNIDRCDPPLDASEVTKIAKSIGGGKPAGVGLADVVLQAERDEAPRVEKARLYAPSGAEIAAMVIPPVRWVIDGILPEGTCLFSGKPKAGKSWLALALTLAVENGSAVLNLQADPGEALYLALEDGYRRIQDRLAKMGRPNPAAAYFPVSCPRLNEGGIELIDDWLTEHPRARIVTIDTLQLIRPRQRRGANPYAEDYEAMAMLGQLARRHPGVALPVVHHNRKLVAEDPFDMASGTNGLSGSADSLWVLIKDGGQSVLHVKGRDFAEQAIALTFDEIHGRWHAAGAPSEYRTSPQLAATLALVAKSATGVSAAALGAHLGITAQVAGRHLLRLVEDGHAERTGSHPVRYIMAEPTLSIAD